MNSPAQNVFSRKPISGAERAAAADAAEATLRLIARLPAPAGLEDRVMAGLKSAPRTARVLDWPSLFQPTTGWMRGAAAAAIVFVVAGGGWGIYAHVQPVPSVRVIAMPPRTGAAGGFSNAGAMRTPETLNGPILTKPVAAQPLVAEPVQARPLKQVPAPTTPATSSKTQAAGKVSALPAVSAVK